MQQLAAWLQDNYAAFLLELIHSGGPSGYFVKDGKKVSGSYYGSDTVSQHYNHVHIAATHSGLLAASGANPSGTATVQTADFTNGFKTGCAVPGASMLMVVGYVGYVIFEGVRHVI
jgi:hypothetical protein